MTMNEVLSADGQRLTRCCDHFGFGHWTWSNTEHMLLATKGSPRRACNSVRGMITAPGGAPRPAGTAYGRCATRGIVRPSSHISL